MKCRHVELRETLKTAAAERKVREKRLAPLAAELGMPFKEVKNSLPSAPKDANDGQQFYSTSQTFPAPAPAVPEKQALPSLPNR